MLGFLFKAIIFIGLVGLIFVIAFQRNLLPSSISKYVDPRMVNQLTHTNLSGLAPQLSTALDSLVVHPNSLSPVVLGLKVTNDSLNSVVDLIQRLPPDQLSQLKTVVCSTASASAKP